jgi:hypothetical protein
MTPETCPKFNTCSAPICPLDRGWRRAVHLPGERTCYYLRCAVKPGEADRLAGDPVGRVVLPLVGPVAERFPDIARTLARAATSGVRGGGRMPPARAKSARATAMPDGPDDS